MTVTPTILYIDDQIEVYKAFIILLERDNFRVLTASSCDEAFSTLEQETVDLILLDVQMPEIDGY